MSHAWPSRTRRSSCPWCRPCARPRYPSSSHVAWNRSKAGGPRSPTGGRALSQMACLSRGHHRDREETAAKDYENLRYEGDSRLPASESVIAVKMRDQEEVKQSNRGCANAPGCESTDNNHDVDPRVDLITLSIKSPTKEKLATTRACPQSIPKGPDLKRSSATCSRAPLQARVGRRA